MKPDVKTLDDLLRQALLPDEDSADARLGEPSILEMATEVYRGRNRWLAFGATAVTALCVVLCVACLVQLLQTHDALSAIRWGAGLVAGLLATMALKLWHWMEMNRLSISREIKRVELQVARLNAAMKERVAKE